MSADQADKRSIVYGKKTISYSLFYFDRKTMEIAVHPDSEVVVKAPFDSEISLIEKKILKRARWIIRQLNYFKQFNPRTPDRCYINGETHLYLGKQYRLKISKGKKKSVKLSRGFFNIICHSAVTPELTQKQLNDWYKQKAQLKFRESLDRCWKKFHTLRVDKPNLSIKRMKKRWGSLSESGTLTLNTDLIRAPKDCIDYVVMHELCHLKYHDHSSEFYKILDSVIPNWEKIKHKLEIHMS